MNHPPKKLFQKTPKFENLSPDLAVAVCRISQYNTIVTSICHLCNYMETLACIKCFPAISARLFPAVASAASPIESLSFNPIFTKKNSKTGFLGKNSVFGFFIIHQI